MQLIQEEIKKDPFQMHGEWGAIGDRKGEVMFLTHNPKESVTLRPDQDDNYVFHSHPPFGQPFDSSASEQDHLAAAHTYLEHNNRTNEYLTNGRDVLHIPPASMELVQLHPDPKREETLGKFPEAFRLPKPEQPPYPFQNHEAPAAFKENWQPPEGWQPPEDYPRG
jgi:hypothetical protein